MDWVYYLTDGYINELFTLIASDYKVLATFLGGPIIFYLSKLVKLTPWKSDDILADKIAAKLNNKELNGDN